MSLIFSLFIFKGRIPSRKTSIRTSVSMIPFSLTLLTLLKCLIQYSYLSLIVLTLLKCLIQYLYPTLNPSHPLSLLLRIEWLEKYTERKKVAIPQLIQVQESELTSKNEVTVSHPPLQTKSKLQFEKPIDQNLPIAIKEGMRECTKCLLYPLSHVVSFEKLSPSIIAFLHVWTIFIFQPLYLRLYLMKIGDKL